MTPESRDQCIHRGRALETGDHLFDTRHLMRRQPLTRQPSVLRRHLLDRERAALAAQRKINAAGEDLAVLERYLEVTLKNGQVLTRSVDFPLGGERRPLSIEQMTAKYRRLAGKRLSPHQVARIEEVVAGLERAPAVDTLIAALRGHADG